MMVAGALLLIPTLVTFLGTAVIGISPAFVLGVVLLAVGATMRAGLVQGSLMIHRLDRTDRTIRRAARRLANLAFP